MEACCAQILIFFVQVVLHFQNEEHGGTKMGIILIHASFFKTN